jgi:predicted amidophosphoribosyltransferase
MLLASTCPGCGARAGSPCRACAAALRPPPALPPPTGVDGCAAVVAYEGVARGIVGGLKYRNARGALGALARAMASAARAWAPEIDVVTWAPTTTKRRRRRGFDQSELLARVVARALRRPCVPLLRRVDASAQTGRSRADRAVGPQVVARSRAGVPARVLVVDDVVTTGATVAAAAAALRAAGAQRVWVVAAARTPLKARASPDEHKA